MVRLKTRSMSCTSRRQPQMSRRIGGAFFGCPERCENLSAPPGVGVRRRECCAVTRRASARVRGRGRLIGRTTRRQGVLRSRAHLPRADLLDRRLRRAHVEGAFGRAPIEDRVPSVFRRKRDERYDAVVIIVGVRFEFLLGRAPERRPAAAPRRAEGLVHLVRGDAARRPGPERRRRRRQLRVAAATTVWLLAPVSSTRSSPRVVVLRFTVCAVRRTVYN
jgi:hypothetical protein